MAKVKLGILLILIAGGSALYLLQRQARLRLQAENAARREQIAQAAQLAAENERLSNTLAEAKDQLTERTAELLRLRGAVTALRRQTNDLAMLRDQNQRLRAAAAASGNARRDKPPPDVPPEDIHPRDSWKFAGYATPDATVESMIWAMTQTNREAFLAGFAPDMRREVEQHFGKDDFSETANRMINSATEFRITQRDFVADDETIVGVYVDNISQSDDKTVFVRINGEWHVTEKGKDGVPAQSK